MIHPINTSPRILFVDDEATAAKYFQRAIGALAPVAIAESVAEGKRILDAHADSILILVTDQRMPGEYGNELLRYAREQYPHVVRILTTAYSEIGHTVAAINEGEIHRYIKKPWDIVALRMEVGQALDLAELRRERDHLVREKLVIRQTQIIANRIGALYSLCINLCGPGRCGAIETYLKAALEVGAKCPNPDWLLMDYSDVVSAEADRSGRFGYAVRLKLEQIARQYVGQDAKSVLTTLVDLTCGRVCADEANNVVYLKEEKLAEFLETPCDVDVSDDHASWLGFLLWADQSGWVLQIDRTSAGLSGIFKPSAEMPAQLQLAAWIDQF